MKKLSEMTKQELKKLSDEQKKEIIMRELKEIINKNKLFVNTEIKVTYR